jgi:Raf kinase inhibitor-like YbhB/YbcL family protein
VAIGLSHALAATGENEAPEHEAPPEFKLSSPAFENGKPIPLKHTGEGVDVSPPLHWIEPPQGTKTFALIADDPDAPMGTWVHWVMYNVPGALRELKEGIPAIEKLSDGTVQGVNDFGKIGYNGPMPPPGKPHRYYFTLYALDTPLELPAKATKKKLEQAMEDHVLGEAKLMGTYAR